MLSVITGKQRSGKSYYCVTLVIEYLRSCNRPIFANLSLNPDIVCDIACGGRLRHPALYESYLKRIHLFKNFKGRRKRPEYPFFKKNNPDYIQLHKDGLKYGERYIYDESCIMTFWRIIKPNSIVFLDELYQYFNSRMVFERDSEIQALRKELLTYTRQHGHMKDDMYLISHDKSDLDSHIRKGIQRQFVVENLKYKNISNNDFLKGLKWPVQIFQVRAFEYGEKEHSDKYNIFPNKRFFKAYDSFSSPETLSKGKVDASAVNTDSGVDNKANIKNFLHQSFPFLSFLLVTMVCVWAGYIYARDNLLTTKSEIGKTSGSLEIKKDIPVQEYYKVIFISPDCIVFEDNFELNIGDVIHGCKVKKFLRSCAVVSYRGKDSRVSYSGLRIKEAVKEVSGTKIGNQVGKRTERKK